MKCLELSAEFLTFLGKELAGQKANNATLREPPLQDNVGLIWKCNHSPEGRNPSFLCLWEEHTVVRNQGCVRARRDPSLAIISGNAIPISGILMASSVNRI